METGGIEMIISAVGSAITAIYVAVKTIAKVISALKK